MKTLSLWQPWASLIGRGKSIETRSWPTAYRGPIAIHAAKKWNRELRDFAFSDPAYGVLRDAGLYPPMRGIDWTLPFGAIVAVANLVMCIPVEQVYPQPQSRQGPWYRGDLGKVQASDSDWDFGDYSAGRFAWLLHDIRILPEPIPYKGAQGLFEADIRDPREVTT